MDVKDKRWFPYFQNNFLHVLFMDGTVKTGVEKRANIRDEEYKDHRWRAALRSMNPFFVPRPDSGTN